MDEVKDRTGIIGFSNTAGYRLDDRFGELAMKHWPVLRFLAYEGVRDLNAAEDIAQEAIAKVCSVLRREPIMAPKAYLEASLHSVAADYLERQIQNREDSLEALLEKDQLPSQLTEFSEPLDVVMRREDVEEALSAMKTLPARMAEAIRLRYLEDLDYESIAKRLGHSINTTKSDVRRGTKRIHKEILKARNTHSSAPK